MNENPWRALTQARVGLGRQGSSVPTEQHLNILEAQALARDSLWRTWETEGLELYLSAQQLPFMKVETCVHDRQEYLMRPDLGRRLLPAAMDRLQQWNAGFDREIVFCVTDGLATDAMDRQFTAFMDIFLPALQQEAFYRGQPYPFVLIPLARVATADQVATALQSRVSIIFVGERPGLSAHDSMGIYLTHGPAIGTPDSRRNCISNVRVPDGLAYEIAAQQLLFLVRSSLRLGISGVDLKLDSKGLL